MRTAVINTRKGFCHEPSARLSAGWGSENTLFLTEIPEQLPLPQGYGQPQRLLTQPEARDSQSGFSKVPRRKRK